MAPKKKKTTQTKVKKKKWFSVISPKLFNNVALGESYVADSEQLKGKYITANLSIITGNMRRQNVNMHFRVTKVVEGKAETEVIGYSLIIAALKRLVRRGRNKISDSFLAKTKDKKVLRVKPMIITYSHGTKSVQSAVRLEARRVIREYTFTKSVEEFFSEIADAKLQKIVKEACSKIFPLRSIDMRSAVLEENTDVVVTDDAVKTEKVTIRKKDRGALHALVEEQSEPQARSEVEVDAEEEALEEQKEEAPEDFVDTEENNLQAEDAAVKEDVIQEDDAQPVQPKASEDTLLDDRLGSKEKSSSEQLSPEQSSSDVVLKEKQESISSKASKDVSKDASTSKEELLKEAKKE